MWLCCGWVDAALLPAGGCGGSSGVLGGGRFSGPAVAAAVDASLGRPELSPGAAPSAAMSGGVYGGGESPDPRAPFSHVGSVTAARSQPSWSPPGVAPGSPSEPQPPGSGGPPGWAPANSRLLACRLPAGTRG